MSKSANEVCEEYAAKKAKVAIRLMEGEEDTLLIEAGKEGLRFLGELLLAQADADDCGLQLGPRGAGRSFFSNGKSLGLYIHRLHKSPNGKASNGVAKKQSSKRRSAART